MILGISYPEKKEVSEVTAARLSDDWYMRVYDISGPATRSGILLQQWRWKKILTAGVLGVCVGLAAAWRTSGGSSSEQDWYKTTGLTSNSIPVSENTHSAVPSVVASGVANLSTASRKAVATALPQEAKSKEVEGLKARNRRLEALVKVLRQRPAEKRTVQEQTTYLGQ